MTRISLIVDGEKVADDVEPRMLLVQYLREKVGKTGTVIGCDTSNCGACTVHLDGDQREVVQRAGRPGRRRRGHHHRGARDQRSAAPGPGGVPRVPRTPVRLLHAGDDHAERRPPQRATRTPARRRSGSASRATSAAAPATTTSSRRCSTPLSTAARTHRAGAGRGHRGPPQGDDRRPGRTRPTEIGKDRRRKEDQRLITGRTRWTDNLTLPGMLHLAMVRSPHAHAKIVSIDTAAANDMTNVVDVLTGKDFGDELGRLHQRLADHPRPGHARPLADAERPGRLRRRDRRRRRGPDARPRRATPPSSSTSSTRSSRPPWTSRRPPPTRCSRTPTSAPTSPRCWVFDSAAAGTGGDVEEAIAAARTDGIVIEREYRQQRLIPAFMEPRSVVVDPTGEQYTMWSATQIPHIVRFALAATTGVPESKIRVIAPDVGGGFGGKLQVTPEEWIAWAVGRRLGKPVKYTETRSESLLTAHHGRDQWQKLTLAADKDGTVTGLKVELLADLGAYVAIVGGGVPVLGAFMFNSIYKFPAYHFACQTVLTNKTWTDAYRGAGRPEATFGIERMMDELAVEVGMDPMEIREQNWIKNDEFPFTTVAGMEYDSGNYEAATEKAKEMFGYDELRAEQKQRRDSGDTVQLGIGISTFTEMCGLAPSRVLGSLDYGAGGWEHASVRMLATGKVEVVTGASAHGQGHETAFSQIVADRLGRRLRGRRGAARRHPGVARGASTPTGRGRWSSVARRIVKAADKVIEKAKPIAAHLLEASVDDIEFNAGRFSVRGTDQGMAIGEIATAIFAAHNLPDGVEPSLDSDATYDPINFSFPHGTHLCAIEVDTETGALTMRKYVCVDDIGNIINPLIVAGQVHGGLVQGIAQALWEEAVYDDAGHAGVRVVRRLPAADRGRHDQLRHRPHHLAVDHQHAGHQGRRRGGHHRLDARRWSTRSSTRSGTSASTTSRCRARPSGCGRRSTPAEAVAPIPPRSRRCRTSCEGEPNQDPGETGEGAGQ